MLSEFIKYFSNCFEYAFSKINDLLKFKITNSQEINLIDEIHSVVDSFGSFKTIFDNYNSSYKQLKEIKKSEYFVEPEEILLRQRDEIKNGCY